MKEINIGKKLMEKRRQKGLTQKDLAEYIGVSKASVSKWETNQSYPDITLLPQLASFFNLTIDDLMGYSPQMSKEEIKKVYYRFCKDFAEKNFDTVIEDVEKTIKKYYSCFPLLVQMAALIINHHMLSKSKEQSRCLLNRAVVLCQRVKDESEDVFLCKDAIALESVCYLMLNEPENVIKLYGETIMPMDNSTEALANAYQLMGKVEKAKETLQISMYQHLIILVEDAVQYMTLNASDKEKFEEILRRTLTVAETFNLDSLHPNTMAKNYLVAAQLLCSYGEKDRALELLGRYTKTAKAGFVDYKLGGDDYFDQISNWFDTFNLGNGAPRDQEIIGESIIQAIESPAFETLRDKEEYKQMVSCLKEAFEPK